MKTIRNLILIEKGKAIISMVTLLTMLLFTFNVAAATNSSGEFEVQRDQSTTSESQFLFR